MYKEANVWEGLQNEEMAEVLSKIGPSIAKSRFRGESNKPVYQPVSPSKFVGKVVFFNADKGYGRIGEHGQFFHVNQVSDGNATFIKKGVMVAYEEGIDARSKRPQAVDVQLVKEAK
ncbi:cold-shock protein [Paenibacillus thailandensis]|uniref:Cold-shock protein n=1 Tax=Paenibacillus thailandensis TaxID=393250 RepID=A0ABW5QYF6_9BACL